MSWCALGLIGILTWAMSSLLFPLSLIMFEGCEVADKVISDPQFFDLTFNKFVTNETPNTERARQVIKQCLFEDGELLTVFGLQGKVNMFDPIFNALDSTGNLTDSVQSVPDSIAIPFNQQTIQAFRDGTTPDSQETVEDLMKLNGFIQAGNQQCTQLQDTWTLASAQCPAGSGTVFASSNAAGFNFGSATCIVFDAWGTKNIDNRYTTTSLPAGICGDSDVYLSGFVSSFVQSRQQVDTIFDDLQTSLDNVATANTAFMQSVKAVTARFDPIRQNTLTMYNSLADPQTGLLYNTNCAFIQDSVQNIHDSLCVEAISSLFQATIDIIVLSFMGLFATFFVFCLSRKFSFEKKEDRQVPGSYQTKAPV